MNTHVPIISYQHFANLVLSISSLPNCFIFMFFIFHMILFYQNSENGQGSTKIFPDLYLCC